MEVVGLNTSATAVAAARVKADRRSVEARFVVGDALTLSAIGEHFDCVIDSGLLHQFSSDDRRRLVDGIHAVLRPGGVYHLLCFSGRRPPPAPRRLRRRDCRRLQARAGCRARRTVGAAIAIRAVSSATAPPHRTVALSRARRYL